jgi:hypothetical protein
MFPISQTRGSPPERLPEKKGGEKEVSTMRAYYVKVFRPLLFTAVLTGFIARSKQVVPPT